MIVLTLFGRAECHLCDEMLAALEPIVSGRATIEIVDITEDDELHKRYLLEIPVLAHGDRELCRYHLDVKRVERLLELGEA